ncbi:MAG: hypothetical protein Roseis2KO_45630 [Roseivirga sp.]
MKRFFFLAILLVMAIPAFSQAINVKGTQVSLVPPKGFVEGTDYSFEKGEDGFINVIVDLSGGFELAAKTISKEQQEKSGRTLLSSEPMEIDGYQAVYARVAANAEVSVQYLIFGNESLSVTITGFHATADKKLGKAIKKSLMTAFFDENMVLDSYAAEFFTLNEKSSELKLFQSTGNMFIYTKGGTKGDLGNPVLLAIPVTAEDPGTPQEMCEAVVENVKVNGYSDVEILSQTGASINGYESYEMVFKGLSNGQSTTIMINALSNGENMILFQSMSNTELFDKTYYQSLVNSIRFK